MPEPPCSVTGSRTSSRGQGTGGSAGGQSCPAGGGSRAPGATSTPPVDADDVAPAAGGPVRSDVPAGTSDRPGLLAPRQGRTRRPGRTRRLRRRDVLVHGLLGDGHRGLRLRSPDRPGPAPHLRERPLAPTLTG